MVMAEVITQLSDNARRLGDVLRSAPSDLIDQRPAPDEWSAGEVFAHLKATDDIFGPRFVQAIVRPGVTLPAFDERHWAAVVAQASLPLESRLRLYEGKRRELVALMSCLTPTQLDVDIVREGCPPLPLDATMASIAAHERDHINQLERALVDAGSAQPFMLESVSTSYDAVAGTYALTFSDELDEKPLDRFLLDQVAAVTAGRGPVADVGCGPGHVAGYLARRGVEALGVDLSAGMIDEARRRHPDITFRVGNVMALEEGEGEWAAAVALYSLIHLPRSAFRAALTELHRVIRTEGLLLIAVHGGEGAVHARQMVGVAVDFGACFWAIGDLRDALVEAGFAIELICERSPVEREGSTRRLYAVARRDPS